MNINLRFAGLALLFSLASACSACGKSSENTGTTSSASNGVNDLKQSCEIRATWQNKAVRKCTDCISAAPSPACNCEEFKDFGGMCLTQDQAKRADTTCSGAMDTCAKACPATDCDCYANCYNASASCKAEASAREGCLTQVCGPYCK